jgi:hypothetical protein
MRTDHTNLLGDYMKRGLITRQIGILIETTGYTFEKPLLYNY